MVFSVSDVQAVFSGCVHTYYNIFPLKFFFACNVRRHRFFNSHGCICEEVFSLQICVIYHLHYTQKKHPLPAQKRLIKKRGFRGKSRVCIRWIFKRKLHLRFIGKATSVCFHYVLLFSPNCSTSPPLFICDSVTAPPLFFCFFPVFFMTPPPVLRQDDEDHHSPAQSHDGPGVLHQPLLGVEHRQRGHAVGPDEPRG